MVGVEGARVLEKVHGVKIVNLSCKLIDMEASIVHNVNSNVNMGSHILLVDIEFCLDSGSGFKNDVGLTKETRNKEKATPELSFRDMVVRKNQNDSLVLEISKLDVIIGDEDVRFRMEDGCSADLGLDLLFQVVGSNPMTIDSIKKNGLMLVFLEECWK
ncbi:hypothetical protein V6N11_052189 [Hibiscus sabdariffa]|uniref:Uncharacterized protein n=1 Tax=Hibiscus sabdariffa TaxID=183260 RepID=A0ABR2UA09_9ROSI